MYGLIGKIKAAPGQRDTLLALLQSGWTAMPGCFSYIVAKDTADENTIWVTEVWDTAESHQASLALPSVREAISKAKPIIAGFEHVAITDPVGGHGVSSM